jgi:2',3'-cyclic-nucleotide 2'-phosphodiesterase (5'-nucleotidase family)
MLVTFGNHEFDRATLSDAAVLTCRIQESQFRWIGSNIEFTSGADDRLLISAV